MILILGIESVASLRYATLRGLVEVVIGAVRGESMREVVMRAVVGLLFQEESMRRFGEGRQTGIAAGEAEHGVGGM